MDKTELDIRFTYHAPRGDQPVRYEHIRARAREFAALLDSYCPDSREKSLAFTALEDAVMWSDASIARREIATETGGT